MKSSARRPQIGPSSSEGFTLMEVLVVIVIIISLAVVVTSVTTNARLSAAKLADMNNLRSLASAAMAAGGDNNGRFPQLHSGAKEGNSHYAPYWLANREFLEGNRIHRESLYASTKNIFGGAPGFDWWKNHQPQGTPSHYVYFANDANQMSDAWFQKGRVTPPARNEYRGTLSYDEITRDKNKAFARSFADDPWYQVLWAGICRDFSGSPKVAAVMKNGEALGVNVMYLDGHAEWVPKERMKPRYTASTMTLYW